MAFPGSSEDATYRALLSLLSSTTSQIGNDAPAPDIPASTLYPALAHFLASPTEQGPTHFLKTILTSPYLLHQRPNTDAPTGVQLALREAVLAVDRRKQQQEQEKPSSLLDKAKALVPFLRPEEPVETWARAALKVIMEEEEEGKKRREIPSSLNLPALVGLYEGLAAVYSKQTQTGVKKEVEIEAAVALAEGFDELIRRGGGVKGKARDYESGRLETIFHLAATVLPLLPISSIRALDLLSILRVSLDRLPTSMSAMMTENDDDKKVDRRALAIVFDRTLEALSTGEGAWHRRKLAVLEAVVDRVENLAGGLPDVGNIHLNDLVEQLLLPLSTSLATVLIPSSVASNPPPRPHVLTLAGRLLLVRFELAPFASEMDAAWWGLVDVLLEPSLEDEMRTRTEAALKALGRMSRALKSDNERGDGPAKQARTNHLLMLAEQVIAAFPAKITNQFLTDSLFPIVLQIIDDPHSDTELFESAHSVLLAVFSKPSVLSATEQASPSTSASEAALGSLILSYSDNLLEVARLSRLSPEQFAHAYPLVVAAAARIPSSLSTANPAPPLVLVLIEKLDNALSASASSPDLSQAYLLALASLPSSLPPTILPTFLYQTLEPALDVYTEPRSLARRAALERIWMAVSKELGDEVRLVGVEWWEGLIGNGGWLGWEERKGRRREGSWKVRAGL